MNITVQTTLANAAEAHVFGQGIADAHPGAYVVGTPALPGNQRVVLSVPDEAVNAVARFLDEDERVFSYRFDDAPEAPARPPRSPRFDPQPGDTAEGHEWTAIATDLGPRYAPQVGDVKVVGHSVTWTVLAVVGSTLRVEWHDERGAKGVKVWPLDEWSQDFGLNAGWTWARPA